MLLEQRGQPYVRPDDGGHWRLDLPRNVAKLIGHRVRVEGVRDGHDLLAVETIDIA